MEVVTFELGLEVGFWYVEMGVKNYIWILGKCNSGMKNKEMFGNSTYSWEVSVFED